MNHEISDNSRRCPAGKNLSRFINACDCVVRFNNCKNYGGNSGSRTDVLFMSNSGDPAVHVTLAFMLKDRTAREVKQELPYIIKARQIWFVRPPSGQLSAFLKNRIPDTVRMKNIELEYNSHGRDLAAEITRGQNIPEEKVKMVSPEFHAFVWDKLMKYGKTEAVLPSTGIIGIETILGDSQFDVYGKKYIVGFGWKGWEGHPWELERQLVADYIRQGKLLTADKINRDLNVLIRRIFKNCRQQN